MMLRLYRFILIIFMKRKPKNTEAKCGEGQCGGDGKSISKTKK